MHCGKPFMPSSYPQPFRRCSEDSRCPACATLHERDLVAKENALVRAVQDAPPEPVVEVQVVVVQGLFNEDGTPKAPEEIAASCGAFVPAVPGADGNPAAICANPVPCPLHPFGSER